MTAQISIRKAEPQDADTIARYNVQMAWETEQLKLEPKIVRKGVQYIFEQPESGFYVVATCLDKPVGCLMITYEWSDWQNANRWWIQSVYVSPDYRRLGILTQLFAFINELACQAHNVSEVRLYVERHNHVAKDTYKSLGMKPSGYVIYEASMQDLRRGKV